MVRCVLDGAGRGLGVVSKRGSVGKQDEKAARPLLCVNSELSQHQRQQLISLFINPPCQTGLPRGNSDCFVEGKQRLCFRLSVSSWFRSDLGLFVLPLCVSDSCKATSPPTKDVRNYCI